MFTYKEQYMIHTSYEEDKVFNACYTIIKEIIEQMNECECDEMMSALTGEVITISDFKRMLGILDGLPHMSVMYNTKR